MATSQTKLAKLGIGSADPVDTFLRFVDFDPGVTVQQRASRGTAGTFYTDSNLNRISRILVTPTFTGEPTAAELLALLRWGIGAPSGSAPYVFTPVTDPVLRNIHWFPVAGDKFFMTGVGVDNLTLSATVGEPLTVSAECVGTVYDLTHTTFPAISPDVATSPFMLADLTATGGAFSFGGSTRQPNGITIRMANFIDRSRFLSSLQLTRVQKMDMDFGIAFEVPSGDNSGLWDDGAGEVSFTATFVNENTGDTLTVTAPAVMFPAQSPRHAAGAEGFVTIDGRAFRTGGTGHPVTVSLTIA